MTDRSKAERAIAFLVHELRNEWDEHGITTVLRKCSEKPLPDVIAAALDCATRRHDQRTPACIALDGEHWRALVNMAGGPPSVQAPATYVPPTNAEIQCRLHGQRQPCGGCRADRLAKPTPTVEPPLLERAAGESLIEFAHRIADMRNTTEAETKEQQA